MSSSSNKLPGEELLRVEGLSKQFGGLAAVRDVSFSVKRGEILGLIGPNGAGKTTTFNMLVGLIKPTAGRVIFEGRDIQNLPTHDIAALGITKTFQTIALFEDLDLTENVVIGALLRAHSVPRAREIAGEALRMVHLQPHPRRLARDLTMVDRARLEVARALATQPKLLLLDEVMVGLTPAETQNAMQTLRAMRDQGKTLIVVEHNMRAIMALCDRIVAFQQGQCIAIGAPEEIANDPRVIESYLGRGASSAVAH
jgi:ABC-type branched-subunit amino acid transport system ATPase component